jgi:hypothetical protein
MPSPSHSSKILSPTQYLHLTYIITSKTYISLSGNARGFAEDSVMEGPVS